MPTLEKIAPPVIVDITADTKTLPWRRVLGVPVKWKRHRKHEQISEITVHHSIGPGMQKLSNINEFHTGSVKHGGKGWPRFAYHFDINAEGVIYKCNQLTDVVYHAGTPKRLQAQFGDTNDRAIGILVQGNFDVDEPTEKQMESLLHLIKWLRQEFPGIAQHGVKGHGETPGYEWKSCPGLHLNMREVRRQIVR
jgi:N-acetylmuramoyl-L-alanine amidase